MSASRIASTEQVERFRFGEISTGPGAVTVATARPLSDRVRADGSAKNDDRASAEGPRDPNEIEREAFEKGFEAGERAGLQLGEKKSEAVLKRFAGSLEKLAGLREETLRQSEKDLVLLALDIARKLVSREIQIDERIIVALARVAMEKLNADSKVVVHLNPRDHEFLSACMEELTTDGREIEIVLKARKDLNRGDCLLESEYGTLDGRISEQFKEIEQGLLSGF